MTNILAFLLLLAALAILWRLNDLIKALKNPVLNPGRNPPTGAPDSEAQTKAHGNGAGTRFDDIESRVGALESGRKADVKELNLLREDWHDLLRKVQKLSGIEKKIRDSMRKIFQRAIQQYASKK